IAAYYVLAEGGANRSAAALRAALATRLPDYMIPAAFTALDELPLTPSGKVDRRRLPFPAPPDPVDGSVEPVTELERAIMAVWIDVLGITQAGRESNFFALGGHSLLAIRIASRIRQATNVDVTLRTILECPTIALLAEAVDRLGKGGLSEVPDLVEVQRGRSGVIPFFFAHGQLSGGLYCRGAALAAGPDQPFYAIAPYVPNGSSDAATIEQMAARHLVAVRTVQPRGPYRLGGYCIGGLVAFEMAHQLRSAGEEVAFLLLIDANQMNIALRWLRPLVSAVAAATENEPVRRLDRIAYLMGRARLLSRDGRLDLFGDLAGYPGRLVMRAIGRLLRGPLGRPDPALAPPTPTPTPDAARHHKRAMLNYFPRPFDGRVHVLWASDHGTGSSRANSGWAAVARELTLLSVPGSHSDVVITHLPGVLARGLADLDAGRTPGP
ncbi:MAG: thioesterase domain-containing protein, partial [Gemmatimonadota bacterium]